MVVAEPAHRFFVPENRMVRFKKEYGVQAGRRLDSLLALMENLIGSPEETMVIEVNRFYNQLEYRSDIKTWKKKDYWASRLEFLGKGQGDCEDFAVAKYLTMMQLGIPGKKLFLTYVKAIGYPEAAHLVVSYYKAPGTIPFVLDNYNKRILPATRRKDLVPVYSFTANDLYLQKQQGLGRRINRTSLKTQKSFKAIDLEIHERGKEQ
ncbi:MAG: transglutaminase [Desulfobacteraceae bacterium]|nr:transglutaminase [Desulfobacteraceae bacterium]